MRRAEPKGDSSTSWDLSHGLCLHDALRKAAPPELLTRLAAAIEARDRSGQWQLAVASNGIENAMWEDHLRPRLRAGTVGFSFMRPIDPANPSAGRQLLLPERCADLKLPHRVALLGEFASDAFLLHEQELPHGLFHFPPDQPKQLDAGEAKKVPTDRVRVMYEAKAAELLATRYYSCSEMAKVLFSKEHSPPELVKRYESANSIRKLISPKWSDWVSKYHRRRQVVSRVVV